MWAFGFRRVLGAGGCLPPLLEQEEGFTVKGGGVEKDRGVGGERKEGSGGAESEREKRHREKREEKTSRRHSNSANNKQRRD